MAWSEIQGRHRANVHVSLSGYSVIHFSFSLISVHRKSLSKPQSFDFVGSNFELEKPGWGRGEASLGVWSKTSAPITNCALLQLRKTLITPCVITDTRLIIVITTLLPLRVCFSLRFDCV